MKIGVITGTRAEFGILMPLMQGIKKSPKLDLQLYVTGLHLKKEYGGSLKEIKKQFGSTEKVEMYGDIKNKDYYSEGLARGIVNFSKSFRKNKPDLIVVLGDRLEILAATLAAGLQNLPIAHIHGGDKTDSGHIDESIRHSISKFAHLHFAATKEHAKRLSKMGEESKRIHNVGALGIDSLIKSKLISKEELGKLFNVDFNKPVILCIFHPYIHESDRSGDQMAEIIKSLKEVNEQTIVICPNNDLGSMGIVGEINKIKNKKIKVFKNLDHESYVNLMRKCSAMIGNSSSGIIEAATFNLPVLNIGMRNVGRAHGDNLSFCEAESEKITKKLSKLLKITRSGKKFKNIYGDGKTSSRIVKVLESLEINSSLLKKKVTY